MGMDVYGKDPDGETFTNDEGQPELVGRYFRNNVWWWRSLWCYCEVVARDLIPKDNDGHSNDGWGLDARAALQLGLRLKRLIAEGRVEKYAIERDAYVAKLPRSKCDWCKGSGVRTDEVGIKMGMDTKEVNGKIGWCNACDGVGTIAHMETNYPFNVENVAEFAEFCVHSGGFEIW